jgi:hypothetical protein
MIALASILATSIGGASGAGQSVAGAQPSAGGQQHGNFAQATGAQALTKPAAFSHISGAPVALSPTAFSQVFHASAVASVEASNRAQSAASFYTKTALLGATQLQLTA